MLRIIKQLFCKHKRVVPYDSYLESKECGHYQVRHVWKCEKCGKLLLTKGK